MNEAKEPLTANVSQYGNKTKVRCVKCGHQTYYYGDGEDKACTKCNGIMVVVQ